MSNRGPFSFLLPLLTLPLLISAAAAATVRFEPYKSSEEYKCGQFKRGRVEDRTLAYYYTLIRQGIQHISKPFPHQDLLNDGALLGDFREVQKSLEEKTSEWTLFLEWPLIIVAATLLVALVFPLLYTCTRCISACCFSSSKKSSTDGPYDGCKRHSCHLFLIFFVLVDVFAAAALLVTGQYAQYGMDELPGRLTQCIDDLNVYKRDTDGQIRKLLIDDWALVNNTMVDEMNKAGVGVVATLKKITGANILDTILALSDEARDIRDVFQSASTQLNSMKGDVDDFKKDLNKLKITLQRISNGICTQADNARNDSTQQICDSTNSAVAAIEETSKLNLDPAFINKIQDISQAAGTFVDNTVSLQNSNKIFDQLTDKIQSAIDGHTAGAKNLLNGIGDKLSTVAENVSLRIRQINFDPLYNGVALYTDEKVLNPPAVMYVKYSWYATLVITAIFILLSLAFLFGLFYGLCGRRSSYYNDDCCVRSTGSRFYACGIWLSMALFLILCIAAAALFFIFANTTHLLCDPLERPLQRPDMVSLADRIIRLHNSSPQSDLAKMIDENSIENIVRGCMKNKTFYDIFDMDEKYHLENLETAEQQAFDQLHTALAELLSKAAVQDKIDHFLPSDIAQQLAVLNNINVSQIGDSYLDKVRQASNAINDGSMLEFLEETLQKSPDATVRAAFPQITETMKKAAEPIKVRLASIYTNLTMLNKKINNLKLPVENMVLKLQHAQVLLTNNVQGLLRNASDEVLTGMRAISTEYREHIRRQITTEISSCAPIANTLSDSREAVCHFTIDPINGSWMSMYICLLVTLPIILVCTSLSGLYNKINPYPKYMVNEPLMHDHVVSSFVTDTYDSRRKPLHHYAPPPPATANYSSYSYAGEYHTPYFRS